MIKQKKDNLVDQLMQNALKNGAQSINDYKQEEDKFQGSGFRLGDDSRQSTYVPPKPTTGPVKVVLTFYKRDLFTIDDGEPRTMDDESGREFINDINQSRVPNELETKYPGREVHVEMIDKKGEEYKEPPKPKVKPFSGSGHSIGNNTNNNTQMTGRIVAKEIELDNSQQTTSIRVTLLDGTRLIVKANLTHTIGDIYSHVKAKKPTSNNFELKITFPSQTLSNMSQTIEEANLMSAAIVQFLV